MFGIGKGFKLPTVNNFESHLSFSSLNRPLIIIDRSSLNRPRLQGPPSEGQMVIRMSFYQNKGMCRILSRQKSRILSPNKGLVLIFIIFKVVRLPSCEIIMAKPDRSA